MKKAFEKTGIKSLELTNRFVRSATWEGLADEDGRVTDDLIDFLKPLAVGQIGLIIAGFAYVTESGRARPRQTGIYSDDLAPGLTRLCDEIHQSGGKIAAQLVHAGYQSDPELTGEEVPAGPSSFKIPDKEITAREMGTGEIQDLVDRFGNAAGRARKAGFDAVQLHAAHGYLLNQFLSPAFNTRGDRYGGSLLNRSRIIYEIYEAVRGETGADYPVFIKINSEDFYPGGLGLEEAVHTAANLAEMGLDGVEASGGMLWSGKMIPSRKGIATTEQEAYFRKAGYVFKNKIKAPVILVGGMRSPQIVCEILEEKHADYIALARPLIREPDLVKRWAEGDMAAAQCISCNGCYKTAFEDKGISCDVLNREREKDSGQRDG